MRREWDDMAREILLSPSLMCCDMLELGRDVRELCGSEIELLHADVMDGNFVRNITLGVDLVRQVARAATKPVEAHLMVRDLDTLIPCFFLDNCTHISFHLEVTDFPLRHLRQIREGGRKAGIALNPATPADALRDLADELDYALVMTVEPGFAGQRFIPSMLRKIARIRELLGPEKPVFVDGNIGGQTGPACLLQGANGFVLGSSAAFRPGEPIPESIRAFRSALLAAGERSQ